MALVKIKEDEHGFYVRTGGFLFRPVFTTGNDPKNPDVEFTVGDEVNATYKGHGKYVRITVDGVIVFWENHGAYIVPNGDNLKYLKSNNIYKGGI